jgi:hypothetical protein
MRIVVTLACLVAAFQARAGELKPEEARRLVVGKLFSFNCFEGTSGAGRVYSDGSVAGVIRFQGSSAGRYMSLPPGTLHVKGDSVCASLRGSSMEPCFSLYQIDERSFRGSIAGLNFASCNFTRRSGRTEVARATSAPRAIHSAVSGGNE